MRPDQQEFARQTLERARLRMLAASECLTTWTPLLCPLLSCTALHQGGSLPFLFESRLFLFSRRSSNSLKPLLESVRDRAIFYVHNISFILIDRGLCWIGVPINIISLKKYFIDTNQALWTTAKRFKIVIVHGKQSYESLTECRKGFSCKAKPIPNVPS